MRLIARSAVFFVLSAVLAAAIGYAGDFSADIINKAPEGSFTGKIYASQGKSRVETAEGTSISRMDKNIVWMLMPQQKMYVEQSLDPRSAASTQEKIDGEIERKAVGSEKLNGRDTTKYLVAFESQGKRESVFQWIDETAHIPVKTAAVDGSWSTEFKNIRTGPPDQELFEIPPGYKMMSFDMENVEKTIGAMNN